MGIEPRARGAEHTRNRFVTGKAALEVSGVIEEVGITRLLSAALLASRRVLSTQPVAALRHE
jgi:hypothetical protein